VLPGENKNLQIPKDVLERLKFTVFGYDTFWVTSVENYEADGVIFKGNMRAKDTAAAYAKMCDRLKAELGGKYSLFLLQDRDDSPTIIVLPEGSGSERISRGTEVWLAVAFALGTTLTSLQANNVPILPFLVDPFHTAISQQDFVDAAPAVAAFWATLLLHEWGHWSAARKAGAETYLPFIIPAGFGFLGSFGGITRLKGFLPNREALLAFASEGPFLGAASSLFLVVVGLGLSAAGVCDIGVDSPSFADSFLIALLAQGFLGDNLATEVVQVNSLFVAGWAGLVVNALNCIPVGETDGGRMATAMWGRRTGLALGLWSSGALALGSLNSALAFYWLILVLVLQRGPVLPCNNEMAEPTDKNAVLRGAALLGLPLLVLLPYPVELLVAIRDMANPAPLF